MRHEPVRREYTRLSHNLQSHSGRRPQTLGVVMHGTRSGRATNPTEFTGTINYCSDPRNKASYNAVIDRDGTVAELMDPRLSAWHAGYLNSLFLGLAFAQSLPDEPITDDQIESAAQLVAEWSDGFGFPAVWTGDTRSHQYPPPGITEHRLTWQGRSYSKTDVGANFDGAAFAARVRAYKSER